MEKICLGENTEEVRNNLEKIDFKEKGIQILNLQPGMGKTHRIIEYVKSTTDKILIIVPNHSLVESSYKGLTERNDVEHWMGWSYKCPKKNEDIYEIKMKRDFEKQHIYFPISYVCPEACTKIEQKKCPYHAQFEAKARIIITVPDLIEKALANDRHWDLVVFDEASQRGSKVKFNDNNINNVLKTLYLQNDDEEDDRYNVYSHHVLEWDDWDKNLFKKIYNNEFFKALKKKDKKRLSILAKFNQKEINQYQDIYFKYDVKGDYFNIPYIFKAFELASKGVPVLFSDATFNEIMFKAQYELWKRDLNSDYIFSIRTTLYTSNVANKSAIIYWVNPNNKWYSNRFDNFVMDIKEVIKAFKKSGKSVGVITNKKREYWFKDDVDIVSHYNATRGLNYFKNLDILMVVSVPSVNEEDFVKDYDATFRKQTEVYEKKELIKKNNYWHDKETGEYLADNSMPPVAIPKKDDSQWTVRDQYIYYLTSEVLQSIERDRNLIVNGTKTFVFGIVPPEIEKERTIIKITLKDLLNDLKDTKWSPIALYNRINGYYDSLNIEEIAEKMDLYKKSRKDGLNLKFVETMLNISKIQIKELNEIYRKIPEGYNLNIEFPSHYTLKRFLGDLVYYTENL